MKKIINNLKYIKLEDLIGPFIFLIIFIPALFLKILNKIKHKKVWLICEEGKYARDNGYYFYKYIRTKYPNLSCYYVISSHSTDYEKVNKYGNVIKFKSLKHWLYYLSCNLNISSQKNGNPCPPFFYILHVYLNLYNNRVFLQHGITKDYCEYLLYKNTKFKYFVCGVNEEYKYIKSHFGYPQKSVIYTGFPRFDSLVDLNKNNNQILIMPTWRSWIGRDTNALSHKMDFYSTPYYKYWYSFINNKDFIKFIEKNNIIILFYPHINMKKYLSYFTNTSKNIKIVDNTMDIQMILRKSALLITDYSSVFMDFAYMKKPIVYYQFDKEEFRQKQYKTGYFIYEKDGFGPVVETEDELLSQIKSIYKNNFIMKKKYLNRVNKFYISVDQGSCERLYKKLYFGSDDK